MGRREAVHRGSLWTIHILFAPFLFMAGASLFFAESNVERIGPGVALFVLVGCWLGLLHVFGRMRVEVYEQGLSWRLNKSAGELRWEDVAEYKFYVTRAEGAQGLAADLVSRAAASGDRRFLAASPGLAMSVTGRDGVSVGLVGGSLGGSLQLFERVVDHVDPLLAGQRVFGPVEVGDRLTIGDRVFDYPGLKRVHVLDGVLLVWPHQGSHLQLDGVPNVYACGAAIRERM